jgi:hypothetical protein
MTITSMKTGDAGCYASCAPDNPYGFGLRICLSEEQVEALGLQANPPAAGSKVGLRGMAFVCTVEQNADLDGDGDGIDVMLTLQITDLEVTPAGGTTTNETAATLLYGPGEG